MIDEMFLESELNLMKVKKKVELLVDLESEKGCKSIIDLTCKLWAAIGNKQKKKELTKRRLIKGKITKHFKINFSKSRN